MKIVCISDTHGFHRALTIPEGDVLIHAGDITLSGELPVVIDFAEWMASQPHRFKIAIPGNHDYCFDISHGKYDERARQAIEERGIHFLFDIARTFDGKKFYGSPWVPELHGWAFWDRNRDRFEDAPRDIDVLVTHGPPLGILDGRVMPTRTHASHLGSPTLTRYVQRCSKLQAHVFGHVHGGHGTVTLGEIQFVNAASCTGEMKPTNAPIVLDLA